MLSTDSRAEGDAEKSNSLRGHIERCTAGTANARSCKQDYFMAVVVASEKAVTEIQTAREVCWLRSYFVFTMHHSH